ncbi:MAG TPA: hypothetical protein VIL01_12985 [Thermomicrobiales bacterium]
MVAQSWTRSLGRSERRPARRPLLLIAVETLMGFSAIGGGIGLLGDWIGMPREALEGTPFSSFTIPALILIFVVGGSQLVAAWLAWTRHPLALVASFAAGCILLGWIAVEAVMVDDPEGRMLQTVVFACAALILGLAWRWRRRETA